MFVRPFEADVVQFNELQISFADPGNAALRVKRIVGGVSPSEARFPCLNLCHLLLERSGKVKRGCEAAQPCLPHSGVLCAYASTAKGLHFSGCLPKLQHMQALPCSSFMRVLYNRSATTAQCSVEPAPRKSLRTVLPF